MLPLGGVYGVYMKEREREREGERGRESEREGEERGGKRRVPGRASQSTTGSKLRQTWQQRNSQSKPLLHTHTLSPLYSRIRYYANTIHYSTFPYDTVHCIINITLHYKILCSAVRYWTAYTVYKTTLNS